MEQSYHHGNLREELIRAGIELINKEGAEKLSLRKAAVMCNVSHNAPYSHFMDKEDYIRAIKKHVEDQFSNALLRIIDESEADQQLMIRLAHAYIEFFEANPDYFHFLLNQADLDIQIQDTSVRAEHFRPFQIFQQASEAVLTRIGMPQHQHANHIIGMWVAVQGITVLTIMPGVHYDGDWHAYTERLLMCMKQED